MKWSTRLLKWKWVNRLIELSKTIHLPGFEGLPLYNVGSVFFKGLMKASLSTRASSLAFNFFIALFPAIIFLFTLIPYMPIDNFQEQLLILLKELMPKDAYNLSMSTIDDIINQQRGGLLSLGFLAALFFATNGVNSAMEAFNHASHIKETRSLLMQRTVSVGLTISLSLILVFAIFLIIFTKGVLNYMVERHLLKDDYIYTLIIVGQWLATIGLIYFANSMMYYFGPSKNIRLRFFSAGSTLATFLTILTSSAFSFYVNNFDRYNKVYGSIGTLIVILLWIYFNSYILLIGFELNASIFNVKHKVNENDLLSADNK